MASSSTTGILDPTPTKIMGTRSTRHSSSVDSLIRPEFRSRPWTTKKTIRYDADTPASIPIPPRTSARALERESESQSEGECESESETHIGHEA